VSCPVISCIFFIFFSVYGDGVVDEEEKKIGVIARRMQASDVVFTKKMN